MVSDTIREGLNRYAIGQKLRRLRLRKSMGLVELGRHTGLSPALLSKLERGVMSPTLPTLLRIAMVFSVGLEHFFIPEPTAVLGIVRKSERLRFPELPEVSEVAYHFECLDYPATDRILNAYWAEFEPVNPKKPRPHEHPGVEFLYCISGQVTLRIGEEEHVLNEGDSIYFDSSVPHTYRRSAGSRATALVVTATASR
ncbi:MAG: helix-turn-helix domain-containing protein [Bryobacteraceae bacterium]